MKEIFIDLLNTALAANWVVLIVLIFRFLLKKAPKWLSCLLWGIVALRLVLPFHLESGFSLIPSAEVIPQDILTSQTPVIQTGIPLINSAVNPLAATQTVALGQLLEIASAVWLVGVAGMALYAVVAWWRLRRQVRASVLLRDRIYICDDVDSPFVLGIFRPKIYVPSGLTEAQLQYVLDHEFAHIRRRDHWWKPLGFALLAVYWFNPLLWVAYSLLSRDIEHACDEKVIEKLDKAGIKGYLDTLIICSVNRRTVMLCPVAFGEIGLKERVKGILSYKKPGFWILLVSIVVCVVTAVCFLTNPKPCEHTYSSQITANPTCTLEGVETHTCQLCRQSYTTKVPLLSHTFDAGVVIEDATCIREGVKEFTCTGCGLKNIQPIEKAAHIAGETFVSKEPNCTEKGEKSAVCTACGEIFVTEILDTNDVHDLTETVVRTATCVEAGEGTLSCTRCAHTESCTYEKLQHTWKDGMSHPARCNSLGSQQQICTECGAERWLDIPITNEHSWWTGFTGAVSCSVCHKPKPEEEKKTESTNKVIEAVSPQINLEDLIPNIRIWP